MAHESDGELLRAFQARDDQAAFAALMERHGGMVLGAARRVLREATGAEDVLQATFLTLARKAGALAGERSLASWLYRVALCLAQDERKREQRRKAREKEAAMIATMQMARSGLDADDQAALYEEIGNLSERERAPVLLHHLEGKSYEQAAAELGCNLNTFSSRLLRAREILRKRLARRGVALGAAALVAALGQGASAAELPAAVVASTCQAASLLAAGKLAAGGVVSAKVAALTEGALKMLFWMKVKTVAAVCAVALLVGSAVPAGMAITRGADQCPAAEAAPPPQPEEEVLTGPITIEKTLSGMYVPEAGKTVAVRGVVRAASPAPRPGSVPYKDHIIMVHLTEMTSTEDPSAEGREAVLFVWSMRDNVQTPAVGWRPGDAISLRLRPWAEVAGEYEAINRSELEDENLLLADPAWGEYSVLPRLSAEASLGEKRDQAIRLLGRNGFAVIRNAAEEKVFLDRLAQAGIKVMITKLQPDRPAPAWAGFEQGMLVVCWRDLHSADTLRIVGAEQTAGSRSGTQNTARLELQVTSQEAGRNVPTWKACGVWIPRVPRLEVPGPGKDEIWTADAKGRDVADGLQACLEVKQTAIKPGDDITLTMSLRNVSPAGDRSHWRRRSNSIRVWDNKYSSGYRADFYLVIAPDGQSRILRRPEQREWDKNIPTPIEIQPGKTWTLAGIADDVIVKSLKSLGLDTSKEGIYTITGYYEADASQGPRRDNSGVPFWAGQVATPPVEVQVGATNATSGFLGAEAGWGECRAELRDIHGLWGGTSVILYGSGQCWIRVVEKQPQEKRFARQIPAEEARRILRLCVESDLLATQIPDRAGVPDEARPSLILADAAGRTQAVSKWANDRVPAFDKVRDALRALGEKTKATKPEYEGRFQADWKPTPPIKRGQEPF